MLTAQLMRADSQAQKITLQPLREIYFEESELAMPPAEDTQEDTTERFRVLELAHWTRASAPAFARVSPKLQRTGGAMKIAVMGSGGVGGYFGARLAKGGADVHFVARGAHLAAMRETASPSRAGPTRSMCPR